MLNHEATSAPATILLVDDALDNIRFLIKALHSAGYIVKTEARGSEALETARSAPPDLILLDIMMPDMDGYEVCRHLKADTRTRDIPVIFLSARHETPDKVMGFASGGVDYLTKPFHTQEVLARVMTHLTLRRLQKELEVQNAWLQREIAERQRAEITLQEYQEHLESLVTVRTAALESEILERRHAEIALRASEARFRNTFEQAAVGISHLAPDGRYLRVNQRLCDITGYTQEEMLAQTMQAITYPADLGKSRYSLRHIQNGEVAMYALEKRYLRKDGSIVWVNVTVSPVYSQPGVLDYIVSVVQDITQRKAMEVQLQQYTEQLEQLVAEKVHQLEISHARIVQTAKLASLGEMATAVAHELNQPLTAMQFEADYLKLLAQKAMNDETDCPLDAVELYQMGDNLTRDIARSRRITDYLRRFGGVFHGQCTYVNLNESLQDCFILIEARLKHHNIHIRQQLAPDLPLIWANTHKMEHIFLNLIKNAEYALEEMAARIFEGQVSRPDYQKTLEILTYAAADKVIVEIRDNGCGISADVHPHIFEPFFTTHTESASSGLGLSASHALVEECGGTITFESTENVGTTFKLEFPATECQKPTTENP